MSDERYDAARERWLPIEPLPEPFGVLWGRLWNDRRRRGQRALPALIYSWLDAHAIHTLAGGDA